jgi:ABC-type Mn2+/Zn2+ transport system ATPase subunit
VIANPKILFLDEPTSGLDAHTAQSVMETLCLLAQHNYSIVCTIHQPRHTIFEMFDMLMVSPHLSLSLSLSLSVSLLLRQAEVLIRKVAFLRCIRMCVRTCM